MTESIYFSLKHAAANKAGQHSKGQISYRILTDELHQNLFITIVGNEGGGWFSNEIVGVSKIEEILSKLKTKSPLPTKSFAPAFESKSANNAGFLVAVLRAEGLLNAAEESRLHLVSEDWELWKSMMLTEPGEIYESPLSKSEMQKMSAKTVPNEKGKINSLPNSKQGKRAGKNALNELIPDVSVDENLESDADIDAEETELENLLEQDE
jgi:hypothetical protein